MEEGVEGIYGSSLLSQRYSFKICWDEENAKAKNLSTKSVNAPIRA